MGWLQGWTYRKSISLSRASGAVTNYQMKILVGESSGASGEDVDCGGHCLPSFNDLRFTTDDETTLIDYWIESISGTTPNQLATVWVEFNSIGTGATTFYMYYGNSGASAASNAANTFIYFDDFLGSALGADWTSSGTAAEVSGSIVTVTGQNAADSAIISTTTFPVDRAFRGRIKTDHYNDATRREFAGLQNPAGLNPCTLTLPSHASLTAKHLVQKSDSTNSNITGGISAGSFAVWDIIRKSTTDVIFRQGDANEVTITSANIPDVSLPIRLVAGTLTSAKIYADWVLIRQYASPEPAFGSWGSEVTPLGIPLGYGALVFESFGITVEMVVEQVPLGFAALVFEAYGVAVEVLPGATMTEVWTSKKPTFTCDSGKRPSAIWTAEV